MALKNCGPWDGGTAGAGAGWDPHTGHGPLWEPLLPSWRRDQDSRQLMRTLTHTRLHTSLAHMWPVTAPHRASGSDSGVPWCESGQTGRTARLRLGQTHASELQLEGGGTLLPACCAHMSHTCFHGAPQLAVVKNCPVHPEGTSGRPCYCSGLLLSQCCPRVSGEFCVSSALTSPWLPVRGGRHGLRSWGEPFCPSSASGLPASPRAPRCFSLTSL